ARDALLNVGIGGFYGPEQDDNNSNKRWVLDVDFTWSPLARLLVAGEIVYGGEDGREFRERGIPIAASEGVRGVHWWGSYILAHYDVYEWLGFSFRYGFFDDMDGGRTGVTQVLQSWTFVPILHLSRLIPDLAPTGAAFTRTRHPVDWVDVKLEYRLNHSNQPVFSDAKPGVAIVEGDKTGHQVQLQLVVNF
ncbi:MAG TPA: outer membrane beta-barrel protein, partial [Candidatus Tectomicrobia bacterium]